MSTFAAAAPRVLPHFTLPASPLSATVRAAQSMLHEASRIRVVDTDDADVLHTVGPARDGQIWPPGMRRVHTLARIELRDGRLDPDARWVRRIRHGLPSGTVLISHGEIASRLLVAVGLAPGGNVFRLPLIGMFAPDAPGHSPRSRARARHELGLSPGIRLVLGTDPDASCRAARGWAGALMRRHPSGVVAGFLLGHGPAAMDCALRRYDETVLSDRLDYRHLLAAADVVVATAGSLDAESVAVDAAAAGIPVIAVSTDAAAETVFSNGNGRVVPPRAAHIAHAVALQLETGLPARRDINRDPQADVAQVAHGLLRAYRRALSLPATTETGAIHDGYATVSKLG